MENKNKSLIKYPCDFIIKVTGVMHENFSKSIIQEIKKIDKKFDASKIEIKSSKNGKYIGLTCNVYVNSKKELDSIYRNLTAHPDTRFII
jgi:putative lipoic acid-binding regulatory protein